MKTTEKKFESMKLEKFQIGSIFGGDCTCSFPCAASSNALCCGRLECSDDVPTGLDGATVADKD